MSALLASGAFVALLPLGLAIGRALGIGRARDRIALALPLAIGTLSIPMVIAALAGHFSTQWNGACGWLLAIVSATLFTRTRPNGFAGSPWKPLTSTFGVAAAVLAFAAVIYALGVVESPVGSRDEGIYTLTALALERAGTAEISGLTALARASGLFEPFVSGILFHLPGIPAAEQLRPQFSPLLPAWIAQLHAVGGDRLLYRFNLLAAVASGAVFYALARCVVRGPCALLALVVFALNPAQVWIARINLAEPLGALFSLAGLLLVAAALRGGDRRIGAAAIAMLALAAVVRVDMLVISPLLVAAATIMASDARDRAQGITLVRLGVFALIAQAAAIAVLASWSPPYVREHLQILLLAPAAGALAVVAYAVAQRFPAPPLRAQGRTLIAHTLCVAIAIAFVYAAFVRPHVEPFTLIPDRGSILAGTRDFREDSLRNLAAYIGWPTVVLALFGALVAIQRVMGGRSSRALTTLAAVGIAAAVVYLWAPGVSPDHPWAIRRMTTLVIPLSIVIAAYGLQSLPYAKVGYRQRRLTWVAAPAVALALLALQWPTLRFFENAGLTAQVRAIEAGLPSGPVIVRGYEGLATTLALGFGRDVLPLRDELIAVNAASRRFWHECDTRACTLLHASYEGLNGLRIDAAQTLQLSREYVEPTFEPLASHRRRETLSVLASRVSGLAETPPPSNAGAARDWRIDDRGLYRDELQQNAVARWTRGDATMTLAPLAADHIEVRLASAAVGPVPLRIEVDGVSRFDGSIGPGEGRWRFPLDRVTRAAHQLTLRSGTFVPASPGTSGDRRTLGVSVRAVRLLAGVAPFLAAESPATDFRSRVEIRRIVRDPPDAPADTRVFRVDVDNRGASAWPAGADAPQGAPSVALGYYWTRVGDSRRLAEQRIPMPYSLLPGEQWSASMDWDFNAEPLRRLPAGDYEVHIGMVLEGVAWFAERGDTGVTIPVTVGGR